MIKIKPGKQAKTDTASAEPSEPSAPSSSSLEMKELAPGLGVAACGLLAALLLIWFGMLKVSHQQTLDQLVQAWGGSQAEVLQQAVTQLSNDTQRAASNPLLLQALSSGDRAQITAAEHGLVYWEWIIDAQLNLSGRAVQDTQRAAPMNFAALDLVRRAESGSVAAPEAYKLGDRWPTGQRDSTAGCRPAAPAQTPTIDACRHRTAAGHPGVQ